MAEIDHNASVWAAILCGESAEMDKTAHAILINAQTLASRHVKTGHYLDSLAEGSIVGEEGVRDREVYSDDHRALSIEYGTRNTKGQWILTRAAGLTPGGAGDD